MLKKRKMIFLVEDTKERKIKDKFVNDTSRMCFIFKQRFRKHHFATF